MVNTSLFTGLSGLRSHQRYIDVIGNNIANVNTAGFWGSRVTFADLLSFTQTAGTAAHGNMGGQNPVQVGLGTRVGSIDMNTNQGTFLDTGRPLDVALQGKGFFTLSNGDRNFYSRVGAFGVDSGRNLVDLRSGLRVLDQGGANINVPATDTIPARATTGISLEGNLPATVKGPLAAILSSSSAFQEGTAAVATGATGPFDLTLHDGSRFSVAVNGGTPQTVTIRHSDLLGLTPPADLTTVTADQLAAILNAQLSGVTADGSGGVLRVTTNRLGSAASLKMDNVSGSPLGVLGFPTSYVSGTQNAAGPASSLNALVGNQSPYQAGDRILISGTNAAGNNIGDTFTFGTDGTTVGELVDFLDGLFVDATAALAGDGSITLTADDPGESSLSLYMSDHATNTGSTSFASFRISQAGTGPDTVTTAIDVYDSLGRAHPVTLKLTRSNGNQREWTLNATVPTAHGSLVDGSVDRILFNADGSYNLTIDGAGPTLNFAWEGLDEPQTLNLSLGSGGEFDGLTQMGDRASAAATSQDGYPAGDLLSISFESNGALAGFYSNGHSRELAVLRIAIFTNQGGLLKEGETLFVQSPNSDDPILTTAGSAGAGKIVAGVLENSNVDIAEEFVRLIEAQRGFQANARVITTTDQILAELVNIVR